MMKVGRTLYRLRDSGSVHFSYDSGRRKILAMISWPTSDPDKDSSDPHEWGISMEDIEATDFKLHP